MSVPDALPIGSRRALLLLVVTLGVAANANAREPLRPVIGGDRVAEITELFADCVPENTEGWRLASLDIPYDRIQASFEREAGERIGLELRHPEAGSEPVARTPSFDVFVLGSTADSRAGAGRFAETIAELVAARDAGAFWETAPVTTIGERDDPSPPPRAGGSSRPSSDGQPVRLRARDDSRAGAGRARRARQAPDDPLALFAERTWQAGFVVWLAIAGVALTRAGRATQAHWTPLLLCGCVVLAFVVRFAVVEAGPGNFKTHLPLSHPWSVTSYASYGPGYMAWMRAWFFVFGASDTTAFLAGAVAGAASVIPIYFIAASLSGRRALGLVAASLLALWPIHALHSATDEPSSLVGLLAASVAALALAARSRESSALLVGAWLAAALAATTRPEQALIVLPLAAFALLTPETRRLQLTPPMVILAIGLIAAVADSVSLSAAAEARDFKFAGYFDLTPWRRLLSASAVAPPASHPLLGAAVVIGLYAAWRAARWRAVFVLAVAAVPLLLVAPMFAGGQTFVIARYQVALLGVAAAFAALGLDAVAARFGARARVVLPLLLLAVAGVSAWRLAEPPPEPTFRLEYRFFREHLVEVPRGTRLVRVRWDGDTGLHVPAHLSELLDLGHEWVRPEAASRAAEWELLYWMPAARGARMPGAAGGCTTECAQIESEFALEPVAVTELPARPGFVERYTADPVAVGFYRLSPK